MILPILCLIMALACVVLAAWLGYIAVKWKDDMAGLAVICGTIFVDAVILILAAILVASAWRTWP